MKIKRKSAGMQWQPCRLIDRYSVSVMSLMVDYITGRGVYRSREDLPNGRALTKHRSLCVKVLHLVQIALVRLPSDYLCG